MLRSKRTSLALLIPRIVVLAAYALVMPAISFAQVNVIISGGFAAAYRDLLPEFERSNGARVVTTTGGSIGSGPNVIGNQIRRGVLADVVILAREGLDELKAEGRIVPGTDIDIAQSVIGMIVRAGVQRPDISTVEAFKETLLGAKSVAISLSTSGVHLTQTVFPRLGIGDQMAGKLITSGAAAVGRGEAEIGLQQVSEVLPVPNATFVGTLPPELQYVTVYAAAVIVGAKEPDAGKALIAFLASGGAVAAIRKSGMEPAKRH
jgi:molybdate transport system substrate-binding protein